VSFAVQIAVIFSEKTWLGGAAFEIILLPLQNVAHRCALVKQD